MLWECDHRVFNWIRLDESCEPGHRVEDGSGSAGAPTSLLLRRVKAGPTCNGRALDSRDGWCVFVNRYLSCPSSALQVSQLPFLGLRWLLESAWKGPASLAAGVLKIGKKKCWSVSSLRIDGALQISGVYVRAFISPVSVETVTPMGCAWEGGIRSKTPGIKALTFKKSGFEIQGRSWCYVLLDGSRCTWCSPWGESLNSMGPASDPQLCMVRNAVLFLPRLKQNPTEEYGSYSIEGLRVSSL